MSQNSHDIKKLAISLNKIFQTQGLNTKQSMILEAISHANGFKDWNTFSAFLNADSTTFLPQDDDIKGWKELTDNKEGIKIQYGPVSYTFNYTEPQLSIVTHCNYILATHYFTFSSDLLRKIVQIMKDNKDKHHKKIAINNRMVSEEHTVCQIGNFGIRFENAAGSINLHFDIESVLEHFLNQKIKLDFEHLADNFSEIRLDSFMAYAPQDEPPRLLTGTTDGIELPFTVKHDNDVYENYFKESFSTYSTSIKHLYSHNQHAQQTATNLGFGLNKILKERLNNLVFNFPNDLNIKWSIVLNNMAMRYRHDFGLMEDDKRLDVLNKMQSILMSFLIQESHDELKNNHGLDDVTIRQLREEINYQLDKQLSSDEVHLGHERKFV